MLMTKQQKDKCFYCLNWLTGKVHFLDYIDYCELIVEVMGYCARGYGLWKRKEYVHEKHLIIHRSQMHVICPNV